MRIKRSGRVMLATVLTLLGFSALAIWHDRPTDLNDAQAQAIHHLIQENPELDKLFAQLDFTQKDQAFYSVGLKGETPWPVDISRACYLDPLVARSQFSAIQKAYANEIQLIRYRSQADFYLLLLAQLDKKPTYLTALNLSSHTLVSEPTLSLSFKSLAALLAGSLGLLLVRQAKKRRNLQGQRPLS